MGAVDRCSNSLANQTLKVMNPVKKYCAKEVSSLDKYRLGKEIKRWRKKRGMTQNELSKDICHQSEISRIEHGEVYPSIDLLQLFSSKLKVPVSYFFKVLIYDDFANKKTIVDRLFELSKRKKYDAILNCIVHEQDDCSGYGDYSKILSWHYWLAMYRLNKVDGLTCITELKLLLLDKTPSVIYLHLDYFIKNSIANIFAEQNKIREGARLYKEIIQYDSFEEKFVKLKIKALYNFSKLLFQREEYVLSIQHIDHAIMLSIRLDHMALLGQLYYQKAECMERLNDSNDQIAALYQKAYVFFDLLHLDFYRQIIVYKKYNYLNDRINTAD
ncbi:helix-turn-helix domain-containing protein [Sporolactobacillus shoreicorticis]|uniref:helix-turn-helix domain-containing protein n=1 Tax=Sporolactobacillus shoreicorticis TaxID=1923877 RepID=UPI0036D3E2B8